MYLILAVISPGEIEIWEGVLTFLFFPLTVVTAWVADIKIIQVFLGFFPFELSIFRPASCPADTAVDPTE